MRIRKLFTSLALATTAFVVGTALPAQAATADPVRNETVSPIQFGEGSFSLDGKSVAKAKVTTESGTKIMLNMSVKPIPAQEIKRCWTVTPGTHIKNEGIWDGVPGVADWVVPANDNVFCTKKGEGKQVFKKSCDNRVWGVPGGPKRPPKNLPRVHGKVTFADFHKYSVSQAAKETVTGSAMAEVAVYDQAGKVLCRAGGSISGKGFALSATTVRVRSRSVIEAEASGGRAILISASSNTDLHIRARNMAKVDLEGKVSAFCEAFPPPPPAVVPAPDLVEIDTINDVLVNNSRTITVSGNTAPAHIGTLFCTAETGTISAGKQQSVSGSFSKQITYTAGSEPGTDQVTCTLTQDDGQKDTISTNRFAIRPAPVDPL